MREILFKGKRSDNGEWVYGYYVKTYHVDYGYSHYIFSGFYGYTGYGHGDEEEVILETIGQFTGLTDKNGTKIFEGDIIDIHQTVNGCNLFEIVWDKYKWNARYVQMELPRLYEYNFEELLEVNEYEKEIEVIGNIHEWGSE